MLAFRTHKNEIVTGVDLVAVLNKVANDWVDLAHAIRAEDAYASHITVEQKNQFLAEMLHDAEVIRIGNNMGFTIWQRINTELTGECVAFLP